MVLEIYVNHVLSFNLYRTTDTGSSGESQASDSLTTKKSKTSSEQKPLNSSAHLPNRLLSPPKSWV
jgi:hypothetical protein